MKRPLLLAALLAVAPIAVEGAAKAAPLQMFNVQTPSAGVINFSGTGTANFNQSLGTNNSFNVGSSTNLGVNAAASSTSDYESEGTATLNLAGTSRLQQTIGTATNAFNASTASESSSTSAATAASVAADTQATTVANSSTYGSEWSNSWNDTYTSDAGWEYKAAGESLTANGDTASDDGYYSTASVAGGASVDYKSTSTWESESKAAWSSGWEDTYSTSYSDAFTTSYESAYSTATTAASSAAGSSVATGTIKGDFNTVNTGTSDAGLSSMTSSFESGAAATADASVGADYASSSFYDADATSAETEQLTLEYNAAYEAAYQSAYSSAYATANTAITNTSTSSVTVEGIGSIADVNADASSSFAAKSDLIAAAVRDGNGNGNASAGASLNTASYANQSNMTTANAFMQAFAGGGLGGDVTVTGVTEVVDGSTGALTGYDVETTQTVATPSITNISVD